MKDLELAKMVIKLGNSSGEDGELLARAVISLHEENERLREGLKKARHNLMFYGAKEDAAEVDALLGGKKE